MTCRYAFVAAWAACVCVVLGPSNGAAATDATPFGGGPVAVPGTVEAEAFEGGGQAVAYFDTTRGNKGGAYRQTDVDIERSTDVGGGYDIGWARVGEWLQYTANVTASGSYSFEIRVASRSTGGQLRIDVDGADVTGPATVPNTGNWPAWDSI